MRTDGSKNYLSYSRIFQQIGISSGLLLAGGISGIIAGVLSIALADFFFWIYRLYAFPTFVNDPLGQSLYYEVVGVGFPIGIRVGLSIGLLYAIFRMNIPKSWLWIIISGLGTVSGYLLSGFDPWTDRLAVFLEFVISGTMTGWICYELLRTIRIKVFKIDNKPLRPALVIISSMSGFLLIFISVYTFWLRIANAPS